MTAVPIVTGGLYAWAGLAWVGLAWLGLLVSRVAIFLLLGLPGGPDHGSVMTAPFNINTKAD